MPMIDADTHVDETEATWKRVEESFPQYAPATVVPAKNGEAPAALKGIFKRFWVVENKMQPRAVRDEVHHPPRVARELEDVDVRLRDMDRMGVEIQVIFPTFFIRYNNTTNPESDVALTTSYNRWIAERCAPTKGRLRWAAVLPLLDIDRAVEELRWAKDNGACTFFRRGFDLGKPVSDPYWFPLYEAANELEMPVCFHTGHPGFPHREWDRGFPIMSAFNSVVTTRLPEKFPKLRFGFIESSSSWIPYELAQIGMVLRTQRIHEQAQTVRIEPDLLRKNRLYVAIDPVDDIEYILKFGTEDNLLIGTDYCHTDISANLNALDEVRDWARQGRISEEVATKILETNPRTFYGF